MKTIAMMFTLVLAGTAHAQTVNVKDLDASQDSSTTIEIKKNKETKVENKWEVQDGTADVEGESAATGKEAKAAWTKACTEWKKEFRADNKENKIVSMSCGSASCSGDAGAKVCTSKATYKIKTLIN